jgi:hypothetical protein
MSEPAVGWRKPERPWTCESCRKARRTAYCQDCGNKRPEHVTESAARKQDLLALIAHCRGRQQSAHNAVITWEKEHGRIAPPRLQEAAQRWQRYAVACEYLLEFFP